MKKQLQTLIFFIVMCLVHSNVSGYSLQYAQDTTTHHSNSKVAAVPPQVGAIDWVAEHAAVGTCEGNVPIITLQWKKTTNATFYDVYENGKLIKTLPSTSTSFIRHFAAEPNLSAIDRMLTKPLTEKYYIRARNGVVATTTSTKESFHRYCNILPKSLIKSSSFLSWSYGRINGKCYAKLSWPVVRQAWLFRMYRDEVDISMLMDQKNALSVPSLDMYYGIEVDSKGNRYNVWYGPTYVSPGVKRSYYVSAIPPPPHPSQDPSRGIVLSNQLINVTGGSCNGRVKSEEEIVTDEIIINPSDALIFPNPTRGELGLNMNVLNTTHSIGVSLFDLSGKGVFETQLSPESSPKINIAHLPSGTYLVNIATNGKQYHQKIIKE